MAGKGRHLEKKTCKHINNPPREAKEDNICHERKALTKGNICGWIVVLVCVIAEADTWFWKGKI